MVYKLFIEGRIGEMLFCGYLVRKGLEARGFFIEVSRAKDPESQAFTQGFKQALKWNVSGFQSRVFPYNPLIGLR